jgi:hypothetical protein
LAGEGFPPPNDPAASGPGDGFAVLFVLMLLLGIGTTVWKVSTARRMARDSGMDEGDATAMTLLTDDGLESTYLASNLRHQQPAPSAEPAAAAKGSTADRLEELQGLHARGLINDEELAAARRKILEGL